MAGLALLAGKEFLPDDLPSEAKAVRALRAKAALVAERLAEVGLISSTVPVEASPRGNRWTFEATPLIEEMVGWTNITVTIRCCSNAIEFPVTYRGNWPEPEHWTRLAVVFDDCLFYDWQKAHLAELLKEVLRFDKPVWVLTEP